jgi:hypothetical protein
MAVGSGMPLLCSAHHKLGTTLLMGRQLKATHPLHHISIKSRLI